MEILKEEILVQLVLERVPADKFELWGDAVHWNKTPTQEELEYVNYIYLHFDSMKEQYLINLKAKQDAEIASQQAKIQCMINNLPSWQQVSNSIDSITNLNQMKDIVKKLARVLYWEVKNKEM